MLNDLRSRLVLAGGLTLVQSCTLLCNTVKQAITCWQASTVAHPCWFTSAHVPAIAAAAACCVPCLLQVAEVLVAALQQPAAANMVLEIVSSPSAPQLPKEKWFNV